MSDLENKKTEETPKKRPYNLREKKEKKAAYRSLIRPELADELYDKILNIIVVQKKYKDPDYSAKDLAKELKTNTRYLSAVVNSRFGMNYSCLLNEYRVKEAQHLLTDKRYADKNVEEISTMVGFANRQSFYAAFYKNVGETPNGYRKRHAEKEAKKKQKVIEIKEVRLSPNIDENDLNTKMNNARKFLEKGNKVKVTLRFRGREMAHMSKTKYILDDFAEKLADIAAVDKPAKVEGRSIVLFLSAKR